MSKLKVAVVGVTGLVGTKIIELLEELEIPIKELIPVASENSIGNFINYQGLEYPIISLENALEKEIDFALFSAGSEIALEFAPKFAAKGTIVIDNSSAFRMEKTVPLIVPEVNFNDYNQEKIIANPNCSTIQMVMIIDSIYRKYGLKRLVISTYQSVSGTGYKALDQMNAERNGENAEMVYPYPIDKNCLPHCDVFLDNAYTKEEMKLVHETRKILGDQSIGITATAVRVPTDGGHSESVNIETNLAFKIEDIKELLSQKDGVCLLDDIQSNIYPMPINAKEKNEVFVGRIRRDESIENGMNLWIVADNLRKGAATNAVQILKKIIEN